MTESSLRPRIKWDAALWVSLLPNLSQSHIINPCGNQMSHLHFLFLGFPFSVIVFHAFTRPYFLLFFFPSHLWKIPATLVKHGILVESTLKMVVAMEHHRARIACFTGDISLRNHRGPERDSLADYTNPLRVVREFSPHVWLVDMLADLSNYYLKTMWSLIIEIASPMWVVRHRVR